ncbi:MAG: YceI family protein, partial [Thermomicrobiales bacterium]
ALTLLAGAWATPASAQDSTPTPAAGVLAAAPSNLNCTPAAVDGTPSAAAVAQVASVYTITADTSAVRYRAQEELAGKGANEAVGTSNAFVGNIYFDASGMPLACSRFDADLRTLKSDSARRDNYLYGNTLQTEQFPLASFVVTSITGLDKPLGKDAATFTLVGDLTIHGVTKTAAWEITASLDGGTLTGKGSTAFDMPDFSITPPKVGPVISLDEHVKLEVDISAKKSA